MRRLRYAAAFIVAKLAILALRVTGHKGTQLPGRLALKICPDFLAQVNKPRQIIAVTGTNGKTTLTNLLCDLLEKAGKTVCSNRYGSNLAAGLATALAAGDPIKIGVYLPLTGQNAFGGQLEL